jgi:hypothetical protein
MIREVREVHPKSEDMKEIKLMVEIGVFSHAHVYWLIELVESLRTVDEYHKSMIVSYEKRIRNQSKEYKKLKRHKDWLENKVNELGEEMGYGK